MNSHFAICLLLVLEYADGTVLKSQYGVNVQKIECPEWNGEIIFIPDPTDCEKYFICTPSGPEPQSCPPGLWFDPTLNVCNWPELVDCSGRYTHFLNEYIDAERHRNFVHFLLVSALVNTLL